MENFHQEKKKETAVIAQHHCLVQVWLVSLRLQIEEPEVFYSTISRPFPSDLEHSVVLIPGGGKKSQVDTKGKKKSAVVNPF